MAGRRKRGAVKDAVAETEIEEPVIKKGKQRGASKGKGTAESQVATKATHGKKKEEEEEEEVVLIEEEQMEMKEEPVVIDEEDGTSVTEEVTQLIGSPSKTKEEVDEEEKGVEFPLDLEEEEEEEEEEGTSVAKKATQPRGRPRKPKKEVDEEEEFQLDLEEEEEEVTPPLTKRGRRAAAVKPKQEVQDVDEDDTTPVVKKGRRKAAAKPKQEVQDEEEEDATPEIKKGRRRAAATKPKQEVRDEEEDTAAPEIKKGRRRGAAAKPKLEVQDAEEEDTAPEIRKGRGRAAAKPKQDVQNEEEEDVTPEIKKGRRRAAARPKQEAQDEEEEEEAPPQIKRGRPRGAAKPKKVVMDEEKEEAASLLKKGNRRGAAVTPKQDDDDEEEEEETPPPVKKGRKKGPAARPNMGVNATFVIKAKDDVEGEPSSSSSVGKKKTTNTAKAPGGKAKPKTASRNEVVSKTKPANGKENADTSNLPKKSEGKTGVERVVVMKGRAAVDALCPIAKNSHVYEDEEEDDIWDCMLNQTNIQFNNNKFYLIQLLEDDSNKSYSVWMRWGRVGANGQTSLFPCGSDLDKAKNIFRKKFSDKTKNDWELRFMFEKVPGKYDLLKMDYSKGRDTPDTAAVVKKAKEAVIQCLLHPTVKAIIEMICDVKCMEESVVEMKYDAKKAPLGKLTSDQIKAGYLALKRIDDLIEGGKFATKDLVQACNDFYTRVPHYFGMKVPPLIRTKTEIREKVALLEALGDIQAALSVLDQPIDVDSHPTDQHYHRLKCDLTPLEKDSEEYKIIEKYLRTTHAKTHNRYKLELLDVLACHKDSEHQRFKDVGNRMLLWHGSRMSNWAGILSQGLRIAPPEAPVTGYMFGKGIYFADMSSKSANYCWASASKNVGFLLLSEVALGKSKELFQADYNANNLPNGYQSVKGCGRTAPQSEHFTKLSDGTVVPLGPGVEVAAKNDTKYSLLYNEYIVYDTAQVRTRFLLKVQFKF